MAVDEAGEPEDPFASVDLVPDSQRASNPWRQIVRDMTAPAPMSHWAAEVTTVRIRVYDQIRPFVTRGLLLAATAALLAAAPGTWWFTWVLLVPALFQVVLEIVLDFQLDEDESERAPVLRTLAAVAEAAHTKSLVNVTGVMGGIAVPCNIVAVAYFSGPGEPAWAKVLGLAAASGYGVSAIMSFLVDTTHYSANQSFLPVYRWFRAVRPHIWLIVMAAMAAIVFGSIVMHRWAPEMVPLAAALCLAPALIGMKQRDYERVLRATGDHLAKVQQGAKKQLTKDYHNANTDIRVFNRQLAANKSVPPEIRVRAAALAPLISLMAEAIDHDQWVDQQERPSLAGIAGKAGSDASLNLEVDIRLDHLAPENYALARALITGLLVNVGQAMARVRGELSERNEELADDRVRVVGEIRRGEIHLSVRDPLPPITEWCRDGSTTQWLHRDLQARGGAGLSQHPLDPSNPKAGKEVRAIWPVQGPPLRLRGIKR